ncbi:MAG: hypothetical protein V2B19_11800 [Pseudomonadota bacterium]
MICDKFIDMNQHRVPLLIVAVVLVCGLVLFQEVQSRPDGTPLSVMTFNVGTFNGKPADISRIESIARIPEAPDILILQEVHGEEACRYLSGSLGLPFWVFSFQPIWRSGCGSGGGFRKNADMLGAPGTDQGNRYFRNRRQY